MLIRKRWLLGKFIYEQFVVRYGGTGRDIARLKEQFVVRYGGTGRDIARLKEQFVVRYSGTGRDIARLKEQWKRMKTTAKKELSDFERSQKKTVAGKVPISPSGLSEQIKALLKHEFETLSNPFDDDFIETNIAAKYMTTIIIEDYNLGNDTDETYVYDLDDESAGPSTENTPELSGERDTVVHLQRTRPSYQQKETLLSIYRELAQAISRKRHCCQSTEVTPELSAERDAVVHLQRTRLSYQQKETLLFIYREHARAISRKRRCCSSTENTPELSAERDAVVH